MKKQIAVLCTVLLWVCAVFAPMARAAGPALSATEAYCIIDADTGLVLAQQNMDEELHPASITKVMTLGLACEKAQGQWDGVSLDSDPRGCLFPRGDGFQPHCPAGGGACAPDGCRCYATHDGQRQRRRQPAVRIFRRTAPSRTAWRR